jgi:hypothetical protein
MHNAKSLACRLSRLRVLAIIVPACCLSLALASRTDAQQPPRKDRPFDAADVERTTGYAHGTANPDTGQLTAGVNARCSGYQTSGAGEARPFVRWVYRYEGRQDVKATVLAKYTFSPGDMSISVESPESGGGDVGMAFGIRVTDTADPSACLEFPLEIYAAVQLLVPAESSDGFRGQRAAVTFKPSHTYYIDAYLDLYGGVYGGESHTPTQPAPGGTVTASASATVEALSLQTMARPWIMASITRMVPTTHDTWDLYERALKEVTGREYFATGFWAEASAGGAYDPNQSRVVIEAPKSVLLKVKDSPLPSNLADNAITLQLPNPYDLPLEGGTWHFLVLLDPEFDLTQELPVKLNVPPLIAPLLGTWDVTSRKALASPGVERLPQTAMPITEFYSGKNWFLIVPASVLVPAGGLRPAAGPVKSRMGPEVPPPEEVTSQAQFTWPIFAAPGVQPREVALPGIAFEPVEPPTFAVEPPWWSTTNGYGLTRLAVGLLKPGIGLHLSGIGHPQTQGKVERFHRSLGEAVRHRGRPQGTEEWQGFLAEFRQEYNQLRPHEALGMAVPASRYRPSPKPYNPRPQEWEYPLGALVKRLNGAGCLQWQQGRYFVCEALAGEQVRIQQVEHRLLVSYRHMYVREIDPAVGATRALVAPTQHP